MHQKQSEQRTTSKRLLCRQDCVKLTLRPKSGYKHQQNDCLQCCFLTEGQVLSSSKNRTGKQSPYKLPDPSAHRPVGRFLPWYQLLPPSHTVKRSHLLKYDISTTTPLTCLKWNIHPGSWRTQMYPEQVCTEKATWFSRTDICLHINASTKTFQIPRCQIKPFTKNYWYFCLF